MSLLALLRDQIDVTSVPFSDRGSRLLVYQHINRSRLYIKLAERLIHIEPGIESYLHRPPFIDDLYLVDEEGNSLEFKISTSPEMLQFQTRIGEFCLVFQDENTLVFNLPDFATGGFCFRISPIHWRKTEDGGELNHVRNVMYRSNEGRVISNQTHSDEKGLVVEFIVQAEKDCSLIIQITDKAKFPQEVLPFSVIRESAKQRWTNWFNSVPKVNESYRQKYAYA